MGRVMVTGQIPAVALDSLRADHEVVLVGGDGVASRAELLELVPGVTGIVSMVTAAIDAELLDAAGPDLRVVANVAVGYDNVDVAACTERDVIATNTPGVLTDACADLALALILAATRRMGEGERLIRAGTDWSWGMNFLLGRGLRGKTLGIVGLGEIGQATARRALAFGMTIVYHSRRRVDEQVERELGAQYLPLDELIATSDVISLHAPLTSQTHHLIGAPELAAMKPTSYLVNTSRGPLVDEAALVEALAAGQIAGAGLDVFEAEPRVHPGLVDLDNVTLLPHLGSATIETREAMANLAVQNVLAVLRGEGPITPIRG